VICCRDLICAFDKLFKFGHYALPLLVSAALNLALLVFLLETVGG
jgi:hypothetical protein